jgi:hypothetical protein
VLPAVVMIPRPRPPARPGMTIDVMHITPRSAALL